MIDPVSVNRQGNDRGSQYRTGIYYTSDEDRGPIQTVMYEIREGLQPSRWPWNLNL
ncbi:MAG: peptide-methionine (S)-S-oxide reductase [Enterocloster clostridioformis]